MTSLPAPSPRPDEFSFTLLSDRTGLARPGVFERAVQVTNLLRPDFTIQLGDTIEGYTTDARVLAEMWAEVEGITAPLEAPLFRIPGNHDVGNELMRDEWVRRNGPLHYHFRYRDVLFCMLDTQDPPQSLTEMLQPVDPQARDQVPEAVTRLLREVGDRPDDEIVAELTGLISEDRGALQGLLAAVKGGTQPARVGDEQAAELEQAILDNADVRWTFICMHMPAWQGEGHTALDRLRAALGDRPYTAFAGHCHAYRRTVIGGRDHIRLGTTGGARLLDTDPDWDHVTKITMTRDGPVIANIILDGVFGLEGEAAAHAAASA